MLEHRTPVAACLIAAAAGMLAQTPAQPFAWKSVSLQGMGFVTSLAIHPKPPYDIYIGTDVGGAYRFDRANGRWLPITDFVRNEGPGSYGIEAIALDPSDPGAIYASMPYAMRRNGSDVAWAGEVLISRDRGATWSATGLAPNNIYMGPNDDQRGLVQNRMCTGQDGRLFYATRRQGIWVREKGVWRRLAGGLPDTAPENSPGWTFVASDASKPGRVYAGVSGSGVFASGDNGASWTRNHDGANPTRAAVSPDGTLFVAFGAYTPSTTGAVRRYRGGQWTDITPPAPGANYWAGLAIDPAAPGTLLAATDTNLTVFRSTDSGGTWASIPYSGTGANQPGYFVKPNPTNWNAPSGGWGNAGLAIDPANPNQAWLTNGYGVMRNNNLLATTSSWAWVQNNLEELCVQRVVVPPVAGGADLLLTAADMIGFRVEKRDRPPDATFATFPWVAQGNGIAYAAQAPENMAYVGWDETNDNVGFSGISADNGRTWTPFGQNPGVAGNIAIAARNPQNLVWAPSKGSTPVFSRDAGATWRKAATATGDLPSSWQVAANAWWMGQVLAADAVEDGVFYYYLFTNAARGNPELWASADGGANWTRRSSIPDAGRSNQYTVMVSLVAHPARAGELWLAHSRNTNQDGHFQLLRSTDGGRTWNAVPGLTDARFVAFGRGAAADKPAVYIEGIAAGDALEAIYKSEDDGATWTRVSDPERLGLAGINTLAADMRTRDLVYAGFGCRGTMYGAGAASGLPQPRIDAVVNAASYQGGGIAPGEIVVLFGEGIDGTVYFDGFPAAPLYATPAQTAVVAPFHLASRTTTSVQVMNGDALSLPVSHSIAPSVPGVFTINAQGTGQAVAVEAATGRLNGPEQPFARGIDAFLYISGGGATAPVGIDGLPSPFVEPLPRLEGRTFVEIGGVRVEAAYAGGAPGFLQGLAQVNFRIPDNAPTGPTVPVAVVVGEARSSGSPTVSIR